MRWSTDKAATSQVVYGTSPASLTGRVTEGDRATEHEVELAGLTKGTRYYYRVVSTDQRGRQTVSPPPAAAPASFTVGVPDRTAPAVSAPAVAALPGGTATVSWRTNEPADSSVAYGTSAARLDQSAVDGGPAADHGVQLVDLRPGTRYYYRVVSADAVGNRSASAVRTFVTPANGVADDSLVAFRLGSGSGTAAQQTASGELALAPAGGSEFLQPQLPDSMSASAVAAGGSWQVMAGELRADGARVQLRPGRRQLAVVRGDLRPAVGPVGRLGLGFGRPVGRHRDPVRRPGRGDHGRRRTGDRPGAAGRPGRGGAPVRDRPIRVDGHVPGRRRGRRPAPAGGRRPDRHGRGQPRGRHPARGGLDPAGAGGGIRDVHLAGSSTRSRW